MTQQKNTGMRLRQAPNPQKKDASWLIQMIVAMLASSVLTFTLTGLTGNSWMVMLVVAVWLCIVYGILLKTKHENWFYLGTLVLVLLLTLVFRKPCMLTFLYSAEEVLIRRVQIAQGILQSILIRFLKPRAFFL